MLRLLALLLVVFLVALGAVWLVDQPGGVALTWGNRTFITGLAPAVVAVIAAALLAILLWSLGSFLIGLPSRLSGASQRRRRARGYAAISRGMVAVGSGDASGARRFASEARRQLGEEPLTLLLEAQAAQLSGDREGAEAAFRRMVQDETTRTLGLRGLFIEARRQGDADKARAYAEEAVRLAPSVGWANEAVLTDRVGAGDYAGARAALERAERLRVLDKPTGRRQRAVLLTGEAMAAEEAGRNAQGQEGSAQLGASREEARERALALAVEASRLAPDLVPAAAMAGRLLSDRGEMRRAAKILETAWRAQPHPDLADAYIDLRPGDSLLDRLNRAKALARLAPGHRESALSVARAAYDARDFDGARQALAPLLVDRPSRGVCLLAADIEEAAGDSGRARSWLAKAARAPRDPAWVADGFVSDRWAPVSPVTGRLDAFEWTTPPEGITAQAPGFDDVLADAHEPRAPVALPAAVSEPSEAQLGRAGNEASPGTDERGAEPAVQARSAEAVVTFAHEPSGAMPPRPAGSPVTDVAPPPPPAEEGRPLERQFG